MSRLLTWRRCPFQMEYEEETKCIGDIGVNTVDMATWQGIALHTPSVTGGRHIHRRIDWCQFQYEWHDHCYGHGDHWKGYLSENVVFFCAASQRKVSVQELSWHLHQNKFSCFNVIEWSLWPSLHFCDILSLWLSVWGSVWPLFASVCAHRWYSWSSCHYQMIYDS